jgi:hypothetical protein
MRTLVYVSRKPSVRWVRGGVGELIMTFPTGHWSVRRLGGRRWLAAMVKGDSTVWSQEFPTRRAALEFAKPAAEAMCIRHRDQAEPWNMFEWSDAPGRRNERRTAMKREGFRIDRTKRMSRRAVCSYFGNRGMPVSPSEIVFHAVGTFTSRKWDHEHGGRSLDETETRPALAVIIEAKPRGSWEQGDTEKGKMDVYALDGIYGECLDEVPAPRGARPAKRKAGTR